MEQFWVVMAQWVQSIAPYFAQIKKISEKKLGREAPRVRSQSTFAMKHNPQVVGCVLILVPTLYWSNFYGANFLYTQVYKKYFIAPSAKIVDDHEIRQARMTPQMYYWSSKCPFSLALLLGCLHMCLLRRSRRRKATNNASEQGVQKSIFCTLLRPDYG